MTDHSSSSNPTEKLIVAGIIPRPLLGTSVSPKAEGLLAQLYLISKQDKKPVQIGPRGYSKQEGRAQLSEKNNLYVSVQNRALSQALLDLNLPRQEPLLRPPTHQSPSAAET